MKFWGKIKGTEKDYYIVEATLDAGDPEEDTAQPTEAIEPRGQGVNKFVYYVCNSPLGEWTKLPDLKPSDIMNARCIKFQFSGDLKREIFTNPFYFQKENIYLRAQIARIYASTQLVPTGLYKFTEETNEREIEDNTTEDGELKPPTIQQVLSMENWVHYNLSILK